MAAALEGLKILVVEDEYLIAMDVVEMIEALGAEVVGPANRLQAARELARAEALDGGILDVRLGGDLVFPLADDLISRGVPIVLATGQDMDTLPELYKGLPQLRKPYDDTVLKRLASSVFARS